MPLVEVSNGELLDKFSILAIKKFKIKDPEKLKAVGVEIEALAKHTEKLFIHHQTLGILYDELADVNQKLWDIEDELREMERENLAGGEFSTINGDAHHFIRLARSVYITNDERSRLKGEINTLTNSKISEVKSYEKY